MDLWTFWQSVAALRRVEYVTILVTMAVPVLSGTILLTIRHRIRVLQENTSHLQGVFYHDSVERLLQKNEALARDLTHAHSKITTYERITAPRQITAAQGDALVEALIGVQAAPVIVAAYAFEKESADYASNIAAALSRAGWAVTFNRSSMNDFKGVALSEINLSHQTLSGRRELAAALTNAGIDLRPMEIEPETIAGQLQNGSLLLVVGRK